ncbi:MAG: MFS transporter [Acidimicrobiales bacterium]|nr:MFS transporter [Acidimicrobiia bacterium]NNC79867.1 MFS transporter [Acidimicrobiales bacterium]RZV47507.1 MAG: MFS transporter [Acidimicrobiales bacterium]
MSNEDRPALPWGMRSLLLANFCTTFAFIGLITFAGDQLFALTDRELDLGLLALALFVPVFLLSPIGGTLADRLDKRVMYAVPLSLQVLLSMALFFYVRSGPTRAWPFFAIAFGFGVARSFAAPASRSLPIDLAEPRILERVIALKALSFQSGIIVGPVVAGFLAVVADELPFLMSAILLLIALSLLTQVSKPTTKKLETPAGLTQTFRDAADGLRYLRSNRIVLGAIGLDLFAVLLGGATALLPAIASDRLGVGEVGLGWLRAADGIGAASMSLFLSYVILRRRIGKVLLWSVAVFGFATIALGFTTNYGVAFGAIMVLSAADAISVYIRSSLVPLATPEAMRGRIIALENVFIGGSNELGALESGVAAQFLGLVWAIVTGGIGTILVVAAWWKWFPALRDIDRFEDVRHVETADDRPA